MYFICFIMILVGCYYHNLENPKMVLYWIRSLCSWLMSFTILHISKKKITLLYSKFLKEALMLFVVQGSSWERSNQNSLQGIWWGFSTRSGLEPSETQWYFPITRGPSTPIFRSPSPQKPQSHIHNAISHILDRCW